MSCSHNQILDWPLGVEKACSNTLDTSEMQAAFDKMHAFMVADALAAYPDHNKQLNMYTDSSEYQLGACIVQEGSPVINFFSKMSKS